MTKEEVQGSKTDKVIETMIPYNNKNALISYYFGVFSLIPFIGALLAIPGIIFGIQGIWYSNDNPEVPGKGHAYAGVVLSIGGLLMTAGFIWFIVVLG